MTQIIKARHHLAPKILMLLLLMRAVAVVVESFKALVAATVKSLSMRIAVVKAFSGKMSYSPPAGL